MTPRYVLFYSKNMSFYGVFGITRILFAIEIDAFFYLFFLVADINYYYDIYCMTLNVLYILAHIFRIYVFVHFMSMVNKSLLIIIIIVIIIKVMIILMVAKQVFLYDKQ